MINSCKLANGKICAIDAARCDMPARVFSDEFMDEELSDKCLYCEDFFNGECMSDIQCDAFNEAALRCHKRKIQLAAIASGHGQWDIGHLADALRSEPMDVESLTEALTTLAGRVRDLEVRRDSNDPHEP